MLVVNIRQLGLFSGYSPAAFLCRGENKKEHKGSRMMNDCQMNMFEWKVGRDEPGEIESEMYNIIEAILFKAHTHAIPRKSWWKRGIST